jgi:hypothetical protein
MGHQRRTPNFRPIVQNQFDSILKEIKSTPQTKQSLKDRLDERLRMHLALHAQNRISSVFENSKASKVQSQAEDLLALWQNAKPEDQQMIAAAILYYVRVDDGISDTDGFFGLDDDAEVIRQVHEALTEAGTK